jgi:transcription initiation factor TFIIIB Brf1 subunit/transcription initiation factor TFIIB
MVDIISDIYSQIGTYEVDQQSTPDEDLYYNPFNIEIQGDSKAAVKVKTEVATHQRRVKQKSSLCSECGIKMYKSSMEYICEQCGKVEEIVGGDIDIAEHGGPEGVNDYNTSNNSAAPVRIAGPGSYVFQKKLISTTSNYKKQQKRNTVDQITNILYQYEGAKPPANVVKQAAEFYYQVQQHCIKRGDVRRGTMAACLYRKCIENDISRKPKEIADIFGIPQTELSNGEKILDELFAKGLLGVTIGPSDGLVSNDVSSSINQFYFKEKKEMKSFLSRYFEDLGIPLDYIEFAESLVWFTIKYRIAESSIMSSKCAGTIFILSVKLPNLNIKRTDIENTCKISKSTFNRFYCNVFRALSSTDPGKKKMRSRLRHIFKKHRVPIG